MSETKSLALMMITIVAFIPVVRRYLQHQGLDFGYAIAAGPSRK